MKNVAKSELMVRKQSAAAVIGAEQQLDVAELALVAGGITVVKPPVRTISTYSFGAVSTLHIGDVDGPQWIKR